MASTLVLGDQEDAEQLTSFVHGRQPRAECKHIGVVVLAAEPRRRFVHDRRGTDAGRTGSDRVTRTRPGCYTAPRREPGRKSARNARGNAHDNVPERD